MDHVLDQAKNPNGTGCSQELRRSFCLWSAGCTALSLVGGKGRMDTVRVGLATGSTITRVYAELT